MNSVLGFRRTVGARLGRARLAAAGWVAFAVCGLCAFAGAQSAHADAKAVPALTGDYVFSDIQTCNGTKFGPQLITALATFNSTTGKVKLVGSIAGGDPMVVNPLRQTLSYSNSGSTVTLGETVYQAVYGKLDKGTATYASLLAASDPCAAQITLSRQ